MITDTLQASLATYESYAQALMTLRPIEGAANFRDYMSKVDKTSLADGYCDATDAGDEYLRNVYFSALMVRFWHKVIDAIRENQTLRLDVAEFVSWLSGSILLVCAPEARVWRKTSHNFETTLNQTFETRYRRQAYRDSNLKRNQGKVFMASLDQPLEADGKSVLGDFVADPDDKTGSIEDVSYIIQECIDKNKLIEAIILDNIVNKDVFRYEKESITEEDSEGNRNTYSKQTASFWLFRLVKELGALDGEEYSRHFSSAYKVSGPAFQKAFSVLSKANNQKKRKMIAATLEDLKPRAMAWFGKDA